MVTQDEKGRFAKGHSGGPGRPPKAVEEDFKRLVDSVVTDDDWREIIGAAVREAKGRGTAASSAREFLTTRRFGKVKDQLELSGEVDTLVWDRTVPSTPNTQ